MANVDAITAAVAAIEGDTANVERVIGELNASNADLTAQVAALTAGEVLTQEQIDGLTARLATQDASLDSLAPDAPNAPNTPA